MAKLHHGCNANGMQLEFAYDMKVYYWPTILIKRQSCCVLWNTHMGKFIISPMTPHRYRYRYALWIRGDIGYRKIRDISVTSQKGAIEVWTCALVGISWIYISIMATRQMLPYEYGNSATNMNVVYTLTHPLVHSIRFRSKFIDNKGNICIGWWHSQQIVLYLMHTRIHVIVNSLVLLCSTCANELYHYLYSIS